MTSERGIKLNVSAAAIKEDHRLEKQASSASEDLARHRWHWTLNTDNPKRVPIREYARSVGRNEGVVRGQVKGYAEWTASGGGRTLNECIERAKMGAESEAVTEAISEARGTSFSQTRKTRPTEIRRVREIARERAEKHGTDVAEEAQKVAEWVVKSEKAALKNRQEQAARHSLRFVAVEQYLAKAMRALTAALNESHHVPWSDDEREMLTETIEKVRQLLALIDLSVVGTADVDWDAELARLGDAS